MPAGFIVAGTGTDIGSTVWALAAAFGQHELRDAACITAAELNLIYSAIAEAPDPPANRLRPAAHCADGAAWAYCRRPWQVAIAFTAF